ncbi:MAG: glycerophosphodiester phosphodiesterase [Rhodopseudomonas palustris]|nr:glycerophosphodiester phosphodiesterase [Rhodopseudomonas palustris]
MRAPGWLTARPIAHRGLHRPRPRRDREYARRDQRHGRRPVWHRGRTFNSAPMARRWFIHDDELGRLTDGSGALAALSAAELKRVRFKDTSERMMTVGDLCDLVAGRVPLLIEVKSQFRWRSPAGEAAHAGAGRLIAGRSRPCRSIPIRCWRCGRRCRSCRAASPRSAPTTIPYWVKLTPQQRDSMLYLRHGAAHASRISSPIGCSNCRRPAPWLARHPVRLPAAGAWTVRTPEQRERAARYADQMIFEGFVPDATPS